MSHAALYRKIVADGFERAFVIEDDVKLLSRLFDFASETIDWDFDVISFYSARGAAPPDRKSTRLNSSH